MNKLPPGSGAIVMGTGIVSISLALDGHRSLSKGVLVLAAACWAGLALLAGLRFARARQSFLAEARTPAALTGVAATAVLGSGLTLLGWRAPAIALLVVALIGWILLVVLLASATVAGSSLPATGATFMLVVAPQSLAGLTAQLAAGSGEQWLLYPALAGVAIGLLLYPYAAKKFDLRELSSGAGEHWIAGGALAISALSLSEVALTALRGHAIAGALPSLHAMAALVWIASFLWLPTLLVGEIASPRVRFSLSRWSTVFPVGMYAACSFQVARADHAPLIQTFARGWVWVAVAVWVLVLGATIRAYGGSLTPEHG